jgi:hypothetical protein
MSSILGPASPSIGLLFGRVLPVARLLLVVLVGLGALFFVDMFDSVLAFLRRAERGGPRPNAPKRPRFPSHAHGEHFIRQVREGGDVDLAVQVSSEYLKIVDELECLYRLQAGEQGRAPRGAPVQPRASSSSVVDHHRLTRDMGYLASSNANHAAAAAVALSHAIWTVTPARRAAASCWQACKKWFLDPVISSPDSITKSLDRPSTSLSASLAGEPLATLKTETA